MQNEYRSFTRENQTLLYVDFQPKHGAHFEEDEFTFIHLMEVLYLLNMIRLERGYDGYYYTIELKVK